MPSQTLKKIDGFVGKRRIFAHFGLISTTKSWFQAFSANQTKMIYIIFPHRVNPIQNFKNIDRFVGKRPLFAHFEIISNTKSWFQACSTDHIQMIFINYSNRIESIPKLKKSW